MAMRRILLSKLFIFFKNAHRVVFSIENIVVKRLLFALVILFCSAHFQTIHAQTRDHYGKDFFFAFLPNPIEPLTLQLNIHAKTETKVVVEYPVGVPLSDSIAVLPGEVRIIDIPQEAGELSSWPGHIFGQGDENCIRVSATEAIACYLINRNDASSDGGLAIPTQALHKNYVIMSHDIGDRADGDAGLFAVVAPYDSTLITITPVRSLEGGFAPKKPFTVLLKRGEGFLAESAFGFFGPDSTLAGSFIKATKLVSVINGNKCSRVPFGNPSCDHLFEIAQPIQTWGKHVLVTALGEESIRPSGAV
ncbi:MAG: IgGFc-binding protein, partial [bacterium]